MKKLLDNKYALAGIALLVGMAIGAIFYPSKSITREEVSRYEAKIEKLENEKHTSDINHQKELSEKIQEHSEYVQVSELKMSSLRTENTQLKQKVKERIVKIVTPDGTIREETVRESDTQVVSQIITDIKQEFNEKVTAIEDRWKTVHEKRVTSIKETYEKQLAEKQHIIDTYSKKETIKINERKFGVSLGYTKNDTYFSNIKYDVFGPFFLDLHLQADKQFRDSNAGVGIGISF